MKHSKLIILLIALCLSFGFLIIPNNLIDYSITANAASSYSDSVTNITKKAYDDRIIVYWNELESATTYRVYMKIDSKYSKVTDMELSKTKDKRIKCTLLGLSSGKKYTIKIVPVKEEKGEKIEGGSKVISVSTTVTTIPRPTAIRGIYYYDTIGEAAVFACKEKPLSDYEAYLEDCGYNIKLNNYSNDSLITYTYDVYYKQKYIGKFDEMYVKENNSQKSWFIFVNPNILHQNSSKTTISSLPKPSSIVKTFSYSEGGLYIAYDFSSANKYTDYIVKNYGCELIKESSESNAKSTYKLDQYLIRNKNGDYIGSILILFDYKEKYTLLTIVNN